MFHRRPNLIACRGFMAAVLLTLLVGCVPHTNRVAPAPAGVVVSPGVTVINLSWNGSLGASGYNVKRSITSGGPYVQIGSTGSTAYGDSTVTLGTMYYYVVSAVAPDGESPNSLEVAASTVVPPPAPTNVRAKAGDRQITLTWAASPTATGYHVKRSTTRGGPYTQIAAPAGTLYIDTLLTNGTTYFYVVSAINVAGEGPNSAQVSAAPDIQNPPPTSFGTWTNVTPAGVDLISDLCSNYGATSIAQDPAHPSNIYTQFHCQGVWKSTDYGATWTGPINTGAGNAAARDCSGGIVIPPDSTASVPTIYQTCIRGSGIGFWRSVDGGVNWTRYPVSAFAGREDYYGPAIDPYDANHLLMTGHEFESLVESFNGGQTWATVAVPPGMFQGFGRSGWISFINTGNATTTRGTWLWTGDFGGSGVVGTWRTANNGAAWNQVDSNEHVGNTQIFQPDNTGVVYMAGASSALGNGVLRSRDYGQTWTHVGLDTIQSVVAGSSKNVYSLYGYPVGPLGTADPSFEVAANPGTGTWVAPGTPVSLKQGSSQFIVVNNGTSNILLSAMWNGGVWRYVEP